MRAPAVRPTQKDPRAWALSEAQYAADMQAEAALDRNEARRRRKEAAAAVARALHDAQTEMDQGVIDDGVIDDGAGRFFLRDADEMEEIDASSVPASSRLSPSADGDSMAHVNTECSMRHVNDQDEASACKVEGGLSIDARDNRTSQPPASPAKVSPYLEFQRAVSARSGLRVHVPKAEAALDGALQRAQRQSGGAPLFVDDSDSSQQSMSSQVTGFAEKMGACDGDGWCVRSASLDCCCLAALHVIHAPLAGFPPWTRPSFLELVGAQSATCTSSLRFASQLAH